MLIGDHPRSRGVYLRTRSGMLTRAGSSPLARGLLDDVHLRNAELGIIPARAGFTPPPSGSGRRRGDHPRSRGVYPGADDRLVGGHRIIPARAGFTPPRLCGMMWSADHPRSRGVYGGRRRPLPLRWGSSPLARGLLFDGPSCRPLQRIIPARAGFTMISATRRPENCGSSPLARGLLGDDIGQNTTVGIIPARAGFTAAWLRILLHDKDHPRSRGVYARAVVASAAEEGSSPLARGLLRRACPCPISIRIIPARAGFTCA